MKTAYYFGCIEIAGHFLHSEGGQTVYRPAKQVPGLPWVGHMDCGLLENGEHKDRPDGVVHWTCGADREGKRVWHAFYWWDRSVDSRPGSNSGFYVKGFEIEEREEAFEFACKTWPDVVARQKHPLVLEKRSA